LLERLAGEGVKALDDVAAALPQMGRHGAVTRSARSRTSGCRSPWWLVHPRGWRGGRLLVEHQRRVLPHAFGGHPA
jgi:hypothetical protein